MPFGGWKWDQEGKPRLRAEGQGWQTLIWKSLGKASVPGTEKPD